MTRRGGIPPVPSRDPQERQFLEAMKEAVEVGKGHRGDPMDRYVSLRDLLDSGVAKLARNAGQSYIPGAALAPATEDEKPNLSTPGAPTGLTADKGLGVIFLTWDEAAYKNHSHTNIYRHTEDNFANATVVTNEHGLIYADRVPYEVIDQETNRIRGYYYWITFVSDAGVEGPPNDVVGTYQEPEAEPDYMLQRLTSLITESQLHGDLTQRIDLIDGPDSLSGSVAARVKEETQERESQDQALAASIGQLTTRLDGNEATVQQSMQSIDGIQAQWTIKTDVNGRVAGVGLMNDGASSSFQILASNFSVIDPLNPSKVVLGTYAGSAVIDGAYMKTASIQSAAIGSLAVEKLVGNKASFVSSNITYGSITNAKIADAAITNAKIASAAIDRLKIGDNAVTIPVSSTSNSSVPLTGSMQDIRAINFLAPESMMFQFLFGCRHGTSAPASGRAFASWQLQLILDGDIIYDSGEASGDTPSVAIGRTVTTAGWHTLKARMRNVNGTGSADFKSLVAFGAMR